MPIGLREILLMLLIIVVMFGAKRLPDVARGIGSGIRNFKGSLKAGTDDDSRHGEEQNP